MGLMDRARNICLTPTTEWPVIAGETSTQGGLITGYVIPLAAIGAVAGFIGGSLVGYSVPFIGTYRVPIMSGITMALFVVCMAVVSVFVLSLIINALAPKFGAEQNSAQAFKVAVYSFTPAWIAGILQIVPALGILTIFAALYALYVLYLGLPQLMKVPQDKAVAYTAVVVICAIVMSIVVGIASAAIVGTGRGVAGNVLGNRGASSDVEFDSSSPLGKLQELGKKMEESGRKMDAAEKAGDQKAQVAAAMEGLGTMFGGGKRVDPLGVEQLKAFVPETFAGLPKQSSKAEKTGVAGLMISKAEAVYGDGEQKRVTLEVSDTGGVSGLMGLASWAGMESEKEDDDSSERTRKVDGRLVHEKQSKRGGANEFGVVVGDRFMVSARGQGVDLNTLKAAVAGIDLGTLESMK